jgi:23S rRNA A1618 N6-methylase RlmF
LLRYSILLCEPPFYHIADDGGKEELPRKYSTWQCGINRYKAQTRDLN